MRHIISNLRDEVETTIRVTISLKAFRISVSKQEQVDLLNKNPDFWRVYESSLRTNMFIGLRRIFEAKKGTFNFQKFIDECRENLNEFSNAKLRGRKSSSYNAHEWIDSYMENTYEAKDSDFLELSRLVRSNSKKMKGVYTDAASKIYAHAIHTDQSKIAKISENLNFDEIEIALDAVWHCYDQVWQMFENGREPCFVVSEYPYKDEVYTCFNKQLGFANV